MKLMIFSGMLWCLLNFANVFVSVRYGLYRLTFWKIVDAAYAAITAIVFSFVAIS